jgi:hypothetical protein
VTGDYFKTYRRLLRSELWLSERFTKGQAWVDLIGLATYKPRDVTIHGHVIHLERGQLCWSIKSLAKRWKWNKRTAEKFIRCTADCTAEKSNITTVITIRNYSKYQDSAPQTAPLSAPRNAHKQEDKEGIVVKQLQKFLTDNDVVVDEGGLKARVPKMLEDYGDENFRRGVNDALLGWKSNGHDGQFLSYLARTLQNNYPPVSRNPGPY